jgi:hypothetical protein
MSSHAWSRFFPFLIHLIFWTFLFLFLSIILSLSTSIILHFSPFIFFLIHFIFLTTATSFLYSLSTLLFSQSLPSSAILDLSLATCLLFSLSSLLRKGTEWHQRHSGDVTCLSNKRHAFHIRYFFLAVCFLRANQTRGFTWSWSSYAV